ncbi:rhodanese-like domain-containing protein [Pseudodesulfovibrio sediminis]|uniref:Sulfurtransferase n=1 Tax=Pseudodesulfovibrio sediminis TaxID=2810563 RepID=A0ABM7P4F2_9BACT|nr:rhodanese-like domain-containing protein [Pseudodesulfovibrio sediminis]BCS87716.1 sulfurtransferase [Pseudodesulfovibrio sediminis]
MPQIQMQTADQVRAFLDDNNPESFTLLDVRQKWEYEGDHIPGATLIPLVELPDRLHEVERDKQVIVYCASGGRSMAASNLLEGDGFPHITNMVGGIMSWNGLISFGPMELDLIGFTGKETSEEVLLKAYAMEANLQQFYLERADMAESLERIELFMELAGFEDRHKDTLFALYTKILGSEVDRDTFENAALESRGLAIEGGMAISAFLDRYPDAFDNDQGVLQLASMIEAQALDYYLRCAVRAEDEESRVVLKTLAREEKAHLKVLGKFMNKRDQ